MFWINFFSFQNYILLILTLGVCFGSTVLNFIFKLLFITGRQVPALNHESIDFNSNMSLKGCVVIVICSILVQFFDLRKQYLYSELVTPSRIAVSILQGLVFLVYPLLGYLADVCLTRYRIIKWSFLVILGSGIISLLSLLAAVFMATVLGFNLSSPQYTFLAIFPGICVLISVVGFGLYEANIFQFGLDQLLEAPTQKLIIFIHWCYWGQSVGSLIAYYLYIGMRVLFSIVGNMHISSGWKLLLYIQCSCYYFNNLNSWNHILLVY